LAKLLLLALCAAVATGAISSSRGGDPGRGALVWTSNGCGGCHAFKRTGSSGSAGPNLDRWLVPDARRARLSTGFLTQRRVYWGGRGMPAYGSALSAQELDDLVSFVTGTDFASPAGTPAPLAPLPAPPPLVTASPATVRRWVATERLGPLAAKGAALFAKTGCLSCHTYLGSGLRRRGAPELTRFGRDRDRVASIAAYVARPYTRGNNLMPAYADLDAGALARIAAFLAASKGRV
jgi:mono/diheme cytochrome c family protein